MATILAANAPMEATCIFYDPTTQQLGEMVFQIQLIDIVVAGLTDQDVVNALDTLSNGAGKAAIAVDSLYVGWKLRILGISPPPATVFATSNGGNGTIADNTGPGQLCGLATARSEIGGPTGHGRKYFPFIPKGGIANDNLMSSGQRNLIQAFFETVVGVITIVGPVGSGTATWGIRDKNRTRFYRVTTCSVSLKLATQRRRGAYGKRNPSVT